MKSVRLRAQLFAIPASVRLSQRTPPQYTRFPGDNELYGYWRIDDDSWFHDLLSGRGRWLVMRHELVDPSNQVDRHKPAQTALVTPTMHVVARFPDPTWSEGAPSREATERMFDRPQTINSLALGDASEPFAVSSCNSDAWPSAAKSSSVEQSLAETSEPTGRDEVNGLPSSKFISVGVPISIN
jgi:hypothetical protein